MKKFRFSLATVLSYKQQRLDLLQNEHAVLIEQMQQAEGKLAALQAKYREARLDYQEAAAVGMPITEVKMRESAFRAMERDIRAAEADLEEQKHRVEQKRTEVVAAKQETTSIEKLETKKRAAYAKAVAKDEEIFIDEFVSAAQASSK